MKEGAAAKFLWDRCFQYLETRSKKSFRSMGHKKARPKLEVVPRPKAEKEGP